MTQQEQAYPTRRTATRAPVDQPVQLHFDDSVEILDGVCQNLSIGGMFIELEHPRPPSTLVRFELPVDGGSICGLGEVAWMRTTSIGQGREAGMGIKFRHLEQRDRQLIFKLVSEHIKERLSKRQGSPMIAAQPSTPQPSAEPHSAADQSLRSDSSPRHVDEPGRSRPASAPASPEPVARGAAPSSPPAPSAPADSEVEARVQPESHGPPEAALEPQIGVTHPEFDSQSEERSASDLELPQVAELDEPSIDSEGWPHIEGESGDFDPASRPAPKRDFPLFPALALLLLILSAGVYLLRGYWTDRSPTDDAATVAATTPSSESATDLASEPAASEQPSPSAPSTSAPSTTKPEPEKTPIDVVPPFPPMAPPRVETPVEPRPSAFFSRVLDISWTPNSAGGGTLVVTADGQIPTSRYRTFRLGGDGTPREVIQLFGIRESFNKKEMRIGGPAVTQIRTGYHKKAGGNELHVVIDLAAARYRVRDIFNRGTKLEIEIR